MDIHRCRFIPYPPSAINALAFTHPSNPTTLNKGYKDLRLAIGRANGDIEIWNPLRGAWYQESILRGGKDRSIEGLAWIQDPDDVDKHGHKVAGKLRLFSIGYSTAVTEWDLDTGRPARHSAGNYGEVWCIAAQPKGPMPKKTANEELSAAELESQNQHIAAGCADGSILLLNTSDGDLRFYRILARASKKKSRVLSITFQNRHTIIAGHADSTVRIYDIRNAQQVRNMTLGSGPKGGPQEILVWSVKCLTDGTIVSGDSTGTVSFWDGNNHTLLQRIKSHEADILDLAVSADGNSVFSGGMDRRTTLHRRTGGDRPGDRTRWAKVTHQRMHEHDVKAMATFETRNMSILVSGGLDTIPLILPIQEFKRENHRGLSNLPQQPVLKSAPRKRLVMSWWDREASFWAIAKRRIEDGEGDAAPEAQGPEGRKLVAKILLQGEASITSCDISQDGNLVAISTMAEVRIFQLKDKAESLRVQKLETPTDVGGKGARLIHFSPDKRWLATIQANNSVQLYKIFEKDGLKQNLQFLPKPVDLKRLTRDFTIIKNHSQSLGSYNRHITHLAFSSDSRIFAVADVSGYIDSWVLEGHEDLTQELAPQHSTPLKPAPSSSSDSDSDSDDPEAHPTIIFGQHWLRKPTASLLPKLPAAPLVFSFRPSPPNTTTKTTSNGHSTPHPTRNTPYPHSHNLPTGEDRLLVLTAENQLYEFNVLSGAISAWSRRNPTSSLPREFRDLRDRAMGCVWNVGHCNERVWLYGVNWLWMFDLSRDLPLLEERAESPETEAMRGGGDVAMKQLKRRADFEHEVEVPSKRSKHDTGAGSRVKDSELMIGVGRWMRKTFGAEGKGQVVNLERERGRAENMEDEEDEVMVNRDGGNQLLSLRREEEHESHGGGKDMTNAVDVSASGDDRMTEWQPDQRLHFWHTFKYRPILGIVPLANESDDEGEGVTESNDGSHRGVEVALVERPLWDVDLPPKYYGKQEWDP